MNEIIKKIEPKLVNWTFVRLNRLAQAILIMSVAHYFYIGNVDKAIVINVAVVLAKKYFVCILLQLLKMSPCKRHGDIHNRF